MQHWIYIIGHIITITMSQEETSEDETGLQTPSFLRKGSRCSRTPGL